MEYQSQLQKKAGFLGTGVLDLRTFLAVNPIGVSMTARLPGTLTRLTLEVELLPKGGVVDIFVYEKNVGLIMSEDMIEDSMAHSNNCTMQTQSCTEEENDIVESAATSADTEDKLSVAASKTVSVVRSTRSRENPEFVAKQKLFIAKVQAASYGPVDNLNSRPDTPTKRKKSLSQPPSKKRKIYNSDLGQEYQNDNYCWECHREGQVICCEMCPRVFHLKCAGIEKEPEEDWACSECHAVMQAENTENRSKAMQLISVDQLCILLKHALNRLKGNSGMDTFLEPVDTTKFPTYNTMVVHPVTFATLEQNIKRRFYGSTEAFLSDVRWIVHNSIIFNGANSKVTSLARSLVKIMRQEMSEIETCPDCYLNAHESPNSWFSEACRMAHPLVWARLKGFPFWPAKAVKWRDVSVDVRFFGRHDRSWVPLKECFLFSEQMPVPLKNRNKTLEACLIEVNEYISKLRGRFGKFKYAPHRLPFNPNDPEQIKIILPTYRGPVMPRVKSHSRSVSRQSAYSDDETSSIASTDSGCSNRKLRAFGLTSRGTHSWDELENLSETFSVGDMEEEGLQDEEIKMKLDDSNFDILDSIDASSLQQEANNLKESFEELQKELEDAEAIVQQELDAEAITQKELGEEAISAAEECTVNSTFTHDNDKKCMENAEKVEMGGADVEDDETLSDSVETELLKNEIIEAVDEINTEFFSKPVGSGDELDREANVDPLEIAENEALDIAGEEIEIDNENKDVSIACNSPSTDIEKVVEMDKENLEAVEELGAAASKSELKKSSYNSNFIDGSRCEEIEKLFSGNISIQSVRKDAESESGFQAVEKDVDSDSMSDNSESISLKEKHQSKKISISSDNLGKISYKPNSSPDSDQLAEKSERDSLLEAVKLVKNIGAIAIKRIDSKSLEHTVGTDSITISIAKDKAQVNSHSASESKKAKDKENGPVEEKKNKLKGDKKYEKIPEIIGNVTVTSKMVEKEDRKNDSDSDSVKMPSGVDTTRLSPSISIIPVSFPSIESLKSRSKSNSDRQTPRSSTPSTVSAPSKPSTSTTSTTTATSLPLPPPLSHPLHNSKCGFPSPMMGMGMNPVCPNPAGLRMMGMGPSNPPVFGPRHPCLPQSGHRPLPPEAGPLSAEWHKSAHKLAELMRIAIEEVLSNLAGAAVPEARLAALQMELERANWRHQQELAEVRHNADVMLVETRANLEADKQRSLEEVRRQAEQQISEMRRQMNDVKRQMELEKQKAVEETKKKQWCANCGKEALFFCCWNTSYCDYPCQQTHWPQHMTVCGQSSENNVGVNNSNHASGGANSDTVLAESINGEASSHSSRVSTPIHSMHNSQNPSPAFMESIPNDPVSPTISAASHMVRSVPPAMGSPSMGPMHGLPIAAMAAIAGGGPSMQAANSMKMQRFMQPPVQQQMFGSMDHRMLMMGRGVPTGPAFANPAMRAPMYHFRPRFM